MSSDNDFSSASTIFNMRCLPSAPNVCSTYRWPRASPNSSSTAATQRFQRGLISDCPVKACSILKFASTKGCESQGAVPSSRCQLTYVFHASSGSDSSSWFTCLKNSGLLTFKLEIFGAFTSAKNLGSSKLAASCEASSLLIL